MDLTLTSSRLVTPGGVVVGTVVVDAGRIIDVAALGDPLPPARESVDVGDLTVLPGLVDSHVHVNEPGRTEWEGFATATRAAAVGGVTTIVDMPLNCLPPTTDRRALAAKRLVARDQAFVDVAFWGGAVPENADALEGLHQDGVRGVKAFLCDSGVPEFGCVHPSEVTVLMQRVAALGSRLIVHAEDPDVCEGAAAAQAGADPRRHATWLASRPAEAEVAAVTALVEGCRATGARVHVLHLSAADAGEVVAAAKAEGLPISAETCPHYLTLHAEDVPDGATDHKCAPPIRDAANADRLWDLLADGVIDAVVSDHSPCPPEDKALDTGDFLAAWGGIASLQLGLPLLHTAAIRRGHDLTDLVRWMGTGPAGIAGFDDVGILAPGAAGHLVVFDPLAHWRVRGEALQHRHPTTPYEGRDVVGRVVTTYLAGVAVVVDGRPVGEPRGVLRP